jgi:DNA polymerase-3 subunit epsilon
VALKDAALYATRFVVIDFEAVTPKGRRPEPVEVAALAGMITLEGWRETGRFETLIKPPADVPVAAYDNPLTGITRSMLAGAPAAPSALKALENRLTRPPYLLVAQGAHTEAGLIYDQAATSPALARIPLLCTVRMAKKLLPDLPRHRLDDLMVHLAVPVPAGRRHRAMPDVEATRDVFLALLRLGAESGAFATLARLQGIAGITPKAVLEDARARAPRQEELFEL